MKPLIDLSGKKFGLWTVLYRDKNPSWKTRWVCRCECGVEKSVIGYSLTDGTSSSCRECCRKNKLTTDDMIGAKFGKLTVVKFARVANNRTIWICHCECGKESEATGYLLRTGGVRSCGCLHKFDEGESAFNKVYRNYAGAAKKRGLVFDIPKDEFRDLVSSNCYYCGRKPSSTSYQPGMNGSYMYNGVDRIDNSDGYICGNVVSCCSKCNYMKGKLSRSEFINLCRQISYIHKEYK